VLGNGADELIRLCAVATLDADDRAVFPLALVPQLRGLGRLLRG
jgi:histidinol-phosphate/aromatic aminotransferase/cobyric acid decarboxylase-like protein